MKQWIREQDLKRIRKSYDKIDGNGDGILTVGEVYSVDESVYKWSIDHTAYSYGNDNTVLISF